MEKKHSSDEVISAYKELEEALSQEYQSIGDLYKAIESAVSVFANKVSSILIQKKQESSYKNEDKLIKDTNENKGTQLPLISDLLSLL